MDSESRLPSDPPAADADDWPGLDVAYGLRQMAGKRPLYRKLLRSYGDHNLATADKLDAALAAGDREQFTRLVHTLKGTSGTLGMRRVYAAALVVERGAGESGSAQTSEALNTLKAELATVLASIERFLAVE